MDFDNSTHKVIVDSLNPDGARAYIEFLLAERARHIKNIDEIEYEVVCINAVIPLNVNRAHWQALKEFWESAIKRHEEDIADIDKLVEMVKDRFKI